MLLLCEGEECFGGKCGEAAGEGVHGEAEAAAEGLGAGGGRQEADLEETALGADVEVLRPRGIAFVEAVLLYLYNLGSKFQPFLFHCLFGLADEGSDKHAALARCLLPFRLVGGELPRGVFAAYDDRALQRVAEKQEIAVGCVAALADGEGDGFVEICVVGFPDQIAVGVLLYVVHHRGELAAVVEDAVVESFREEAGPG